MTSEARRFLSNDVRKHFDPASTGRGKGLPPPPLELPVPSDALVVSLVSPESWLEEPSLGVTQAIARRESRREYSQTPLTMKEVSYLLWATQGRRGPLIKNVLKRNVPSSCCRHSLETRLAVFRVQGLEPGIYRYLPVSHQLVLEFKDGDLCEHLTAAATGQEHVRQSAVTFIWSAIPERLEWRLGPGSYKGIAIDVGHVCQNLYLACEALGLGTCAMNGYNQEALDKLLRLDGEKEFALYMAPVGNPV